MSPKYFDAHSHLNFPDYGEELDAVLERMREHSVATVVVGTDLQSSKTGVDLAGRHPEIFVCIGIHPVDDPRANFEESEFEKLVINPKVVAVGECGLDYFRTDPNDEEEKNRQRDLFKKQIEFATHFKKPLMIHSRSAYGELAEIIEEYKKKDPELRGVIHFFTGTLNEAKRFVDLGFMISFSGVITFAREYDDVIRSLPLGALLSETDAPFAAPSPWRGKRNEPSYVREVVRTIASVRGEDEEHVRHVLLENAFRMFRISRELRT